MSRFPEVDYEVVWDEVANQIPGLHQRLECLLQDIQDESR